MALIRTLRLFLFPFTFISSREPNGKSLRECKKAMASFITGAYGNAAPRKKRGRRIKGEALKIIIIGPY